MWAKGVAELADKAFDSAKKMGNGLAGTIAHDMFGEKMRSFHQGFPLGRPKELCVSKASG